VFKQTKFNVVVNSAVMVQVVHAVQVPNLTAAVAIIHIKKQHNEITTVPRMIHYIQKLMPTIFYIQNTIQVKTTVTM